MTARMTRSAPQAASRPGEGGADCDQGRRRRHHRASARRIAATSSTTTLHAVKASIDKPLNLEMAATREMVSIARKILPHAACLVPERQQERTTEGGLDAAGKREALRAAVGELAEAEIRVSLFIAAEPAQIEAAVAIGAPVIELHTGAWCEAVAPGEAPAGTAEFERIVRGAALATRAGLEVHAGHGLDFATAEQIATLSQIVELNIGHFLVGEAIFAGLPAAVRKMRAAMDRGRAKGRAPP